MDELVQRVPIVIVETTTRGDRMHTPEAVAGMLRLHQLGWGIKRIARELDCSTHTVRHYLRQGGWRPGRYPMPRRALSGLGFFKGFCGAGLPRRIVAHRAGSGLG